MYSIDLHGLHVSEALFILRPACELWYRYENQTDGCLFDPLNWHLARIGIIVAAEYGQLTCLCR